MFWGVLRRAPAALALVIVAALVGSGPAWTASTWPAVPAPVGFGAGAGGGSNPPVRTVSNLADSGNGSLRAALAAPGAAVIRFSVGGTIVLRSQLTLRDRSAVMIDATTAPTPGITLVGFGLTIRRSSDIVVRGLRVRMSADDAIAIWDGSHRVLIDRCSLANAGDGALDITEDTSDITVANSLLGDTRPAQAKSKGMLIANFDQAPVTRVTLYRNVFVGFFQRSPQVSTPGYVQMVNNVVADWDYYGSRWRGGATADLIGNVFASQNHPGQAITLGADTGSLGGDAASLYLNGNLVPEAASIPPSASAPLGSSPSVPALSAARVAAEIPGRAGAFPRDAVDAALLGMTRRSLSTVAG